MIVINSKNYTSGSDTLHLVGQIEKYLPGAIVAVPTTDLHLVSFYHNRMKIFSQHVDSSLGNRATGFVLPEAVKKQGAFGTILNHSEHPISLKEIRETMKNCAKNNLKVILCVSTLVQAKKFKDLRPWAMAYEDKKLVGSGKSITQYKAGDVEKFAKLLSRTKIIPLCGAGISSSEDVSAAKELGCKGVLIASAVANAKGKALEKVLVDLQNA